MEVDRWILPVFWSEILFYLSSLTVEAAIRRITVFFLLYLFVFVTF